MRFLVARHKEKFLAITRFDRKLAHIWNTSFFRNYSVQTESCGVEKCTWQRNNVLRRNLISLIVLLSTASTSIEYSCSSFFFYFFFFDESPLRQLQCARHVRKLRNYVLWLKQSRIAFSLFAIQNTYKATRENYEIFSRRKFFDKFETFFKWKIWFKFLQIFSSHTNNNNNFWKCSSPCI